MRQGKWRVLAVGVPSLAGLVAGVLLLGLGLVAAVPAVLPAHGASTQTGTTATGVHVGPADCGTGWSDSAAGRRDLTVWNDGPTAVDVYLQEPSTGRIVLDVESLGSQASRTTSVTLAAGMYRFVCASTEAGSVGGPTATVSGALPAGQHATAGVLPITSADLVGPVGRYQHWVAGHLHRLQRRVRTLRRALAHGDHAAAVTAWRAATLLYRCVGGAYGAFGRFDAAIDGRPFSGIPPPGTRTTGLPLIEELLVSGRPPRSILPAVDRLAAAVRGLREHFGTDLALAPIDLGLRTHEILEDADRDLASGALDTPSRLGPALLTADLAGTRAALAPLLPLLRDRDPRLGRLTRALARLGATLRQLRRAHPAGVRLASLPRATRETLEARLDGALELLADVAVITDPVQPMPEVSP